MNELFQRIAVIALCLILRNGAQSAPLGTSFTFQGEIQQNDVPVDGVVHLRFSLWDFEGSGRPPTGGNQLGTSQLISNVSVADGMFTAMLNASGEFGAEAFNGEARWLQIEVCADAGCASLSILSPRQPITGAPYAFSALHALNTETAPWTGLSGVPEGFTDDVDDIGEIIWEASGANIYRATGNIGIGTATPQARLHLSGAESRLLVEATDSGSGSLAVTEYHRSGSNKWETGFGLLDQFFIREETPDGGTGSFLAMGAGKVGLQTILPLARLHVYGEPTTSAGSLALEGFTHTFMSFYPTGSSNGRKAWFGFGGPNTTTLSLVNHSGDIVMEPTVGGFHVNSSLFIQNVDFGDFHNMQLDSADGRVYYDDSTRRHKENIQPLEDDFDRLLDAQPMTYTRPGKPDRPEIGYIAEEIEDLGLTHLLQFDKEGRPESVNYEKSVLYLTEIAKAQRDRMNEQANQIEDLAARIEQLETLIQVLDNPNKESFQ